MEDVFFNSKDYLMHKLSWLMTMIAALFFVYIAYPVLIYLSITLIICGVVAYDGYRLFKCVGLKIIDDNMIIEDGKKVFSIPLKQVKSITESLPLIKLKSSKQWINTGVDFYIFSIRLLDNKTIYCMARCKSMLSGGKGREEIELFKSLVKEAKYNSVKSTATTIAEKQ